MFNKRLNDYTKERIDDGYDIIAIKNALLRWGYSTKDIEDSIYPLSYVLEQKQTTKKENNLLNLFLRPSRFFSNPDNYSFKKALTYFSYFLLIFISIQMIISVKGIFMSGGVGNIGVLILTNVLASMFFVFILFLFLFLIALIYFILFNYLLKKETSPSLLFTIFLFSLLPYILINSVRGLSLYDIITLVNISIGVFNINIFFLWSLFLFSLGISKKLGISFEKSALFVFIPFLLVLGVLVLVFFDILRINLLWQVFEKF